MKLLVSCALLIAACSAVKPLPPPDPTAPVELCLEDTPMVYTGSCGSDRVTAEGWTCAVCGNARGCVTTGFVYCTATGLACDDPRCGPVRSAKSKH